MSKKYTRQIIMPLSADGITADVKMNYDFTQQVITFSFRDTAGTELQSIELSLSESVRFSNEIKWLLNLP